MSLTRLEASSRSCSYGFCNYPLPCCPKPRSRAHIPCRFSGFPTFFPQLCKLSLCFPNLNVSSTSCDHYNTVSDSPGYFFSFLFAQWPMCWSSVVSILTCWFRILIQAEGTSGISKHQWAGSRMSRFLLCSQSLQHAWGLSPPPTSPR